MLFLLLRCCTRNCLWHSQPVFNTSAANALNLAGLHFPRVWRFERTSERPFRCWIRSLRRCQSDGPEPKVTWPTMTSHNPLLPSWYCHEYLAVFFVRNLTVTHIWTGVSAYSLFLPKCFWFLWRSPQFWYDWHRCSLRQNIRLLTDRAKTNFRNSATIVPIWLDLFNEESDKKIWYAYVC